MTVTAQTKRNDYTGNGSTTAFSYTFRVLDQAHLAVYLDGVKKTLTTDYTVSGVGAQGGGTVTFVTAPASGVKVAFLRDVPLTQATDYVENDPFPANAHEDALDKLTMITQQWDEKVDRTLKVPVQTTGFTAEIPDPNAAANKGKLLAVKSDGTGLEAKAFSTETLAVITTKGDLIQGSATGVAERIAVGAAGALLRVLAGQAAWLIPGAEGQVLKITAGVPAWGAATGGDVVGPASAVDGRVVLFDGSTGKLLKDSGFLGINVGRVLDRDVIEAEVVNTLTETTVYSFTVPGGTLGTNRMLRLTLLGDMLKNAVGTPTIRAKYGATVIGTLTAAGISSSATRRLAPVQLDLVAANATNAQRSLFRTELIDGAVVTGITGGSADVAVAIRHSGHHSIAEDSTVDKVLTITVQWSAADVGLSYIARTVILEVL